MLDIIIALIVVIGTIFMGIGAWGLLRLPDLFMRLHAPTKASTLGMGSFLIAAMLYNAEHGRLGFAELIISILAFMTAPVSANLLAQAAIHLNLRSRSGQVPQQHPRRPRRSTTPPTPPAAESKHQK